MFLFFTVFCDVAFACEFGMHGHGFSAKFVAGCVNEDYAIGLPDFFLFPCSDSVLH